MRYGARLLARGPGFTAVTILSLALGIGASSSIFAQLNAIVLRSLPIADAKELYIAQAREPDEIELLFSYPAVEHATRLLTGRAEIAAQSTKDRVLIAARGGEVGTIPPELR